MLLRSTLCFGHVQLIQENARFVLSISINGSSGKIFGFIVMYYVKEKPSNTFILLLKIIQICRGIASEK